MTKQTLQFKSVVKDRLFYNQFEYGISFILDEVSSLRYLDHAEIDRTIQHRREWRELIEQRWNKSSLLGGSGHVFPGRKRKEITETLVENLHTLADLLLTTRADFKLVVSVVQGHVYTNDLNLIDQLSQVDFLTHKTYSRALIDRPKNTIQLKNPRHAFRSYFKKNKLSDEQKNYLINFLNTQTTVRIGPAFKSWLATPYHRMEDYFFVDHDETSWLTMLSLVCPGLIRKTQQIIPAK